MLFHSSTYKTCHSCKVCFNSSCPCPELSLDPELDFDSSSIYPLFFLPERIVNNYNPRNIFLFGYVVFFVNFSPCPVLSFDPEAVLTISSTCCMFSLSLLLQ